MPALESRSAVLESCRWDELEPLGFAPAESVAAITCVELRVPCGSPSPIGEGSVGKVDLNRMLVKNPLATFLVRCTGTAMTVAVAPDGTVVIRGSLVVVVDAGTIVLLKLLVILLGLQILDGI